MSEINYTPEEIRLLDEFACRALHEYLWSDDDSELIAVAVRCYNAAAAMIAERRKRVPRSEINSTGCASITQRQPEDRCIRVGGGGPLTAEAVNNWITEARSFTSEKDDSINLVHNDEINQAAALMREGLIFKEECKELRAKLEKAEAAHRAEQDAIHESIGLLLRTLDLGDHARSASPKEVVEREIVNAINALHAQLSTALASATRAYAEADSTRKRLDDVKNEREVIMRSFDKIRKITGCSSDQDLITRVEELKRECDEAQAQMKKLDEPRCAQCGMPERGHNYRHPFITADTGRAAAAAFALYATMQRVGILKEIKPECFPPALGKRIDKNVADFKEFGEK